MTPEQLRDITRCSPVTADFWAPILAAAMPKYRIRSALEQAAFIAQASIESGNFSRLVEDLTYKRPERLCAVFSSRFKTIGDALPYVRSPIKLGNFIYAGKNGNGDVASGDGYRFRGRALLQHTGKANYLRIKAGLMVDVVTQPALLEEPPLAAEASAWWFTDLGGNELADEMDIDAITRKVNGPAMLAKAERAMVFSRAARILS